MHSLPEDCLAVIFALTRDGVLASPSQIAERVGASVPAVSLHLKRLADQGLVERVRYAGSRLTPAGERGALRSMRGRRVLELFFVEVLGFPWEDLPPETARLAQLASNAVIDRMDEFLGRPEADPRELPIPGSRPGVHEPRYPSLWELGCGAPAVVRRLIDADETLLRYLAQLHLRPAIEVEVLERMPFDGGIRVRVAGVEQVLGARASNAVRVEPLPRRAWEGGSHV